MVLCTTIWFRDSATFTDSLYFFVTPLDSSETARHSRYSCVGLFTLRSLLTKFAMKPIWTKMSCNVGQSIVAMLTACTSRQGRRPVRLGVPINVGSDGNFEQDLPILVRRAKRDTSFETITLHLVVTDKRFVHEEV